jgi:hypothetical protein
MELLMLVNSETIWIQVFEGTGSEDRKSRISAGIEVRPRLNSSFIEIGITDETRRTPSPLFRVVNSWRRGGVEQQEGSKTADCGGYTQ